MMSSARGISITIYKNSKQLLAYKMKKIERNNMNTTGFTMVQTNDGSYTIRLDYYEENMHSLSGAYEEALLKHVYPSGILGVKKEEIHVLDVGFGLGYNILALIMELAHCRFDGRLFVVSLEKERTLLPAMDCIMFHDDKDMMYSFIKNAYAKGIERNDMISVAVHFGDARETILKLNTAIFDAVFFDPFSPSRNPECWSVEFLKEIARLMDDAAILTTYSSAPQIRMAMLEAGFIIGKGPSVGGKREGTLAAKTKVITPLDSDELNALYQNKRSTPYRDTNLFSEKKDIMIQRSEEIRRKKEKDYV